MKTMNENLTQARELLDLRSENERLRAALTVIANWGEGSFNRPFIRGMHSRIIRIATVALMTTNKPDEYENKNETMASESPP